MEKTFLDTNIILILYLKKYKEIESFIQSILTNSQNSFYASTISLLEIVQLYRKKKIIEDLKNVAIATNKEVFKSWRTLTDEELNYVIPGDDEENQDNVEPQKSTEEIERENKINCSIITYNCSCSISYF